MSLPSRHVVIVRPTGSKALERRITLRGAR